MTMKKITIEELMEQKGVKKQKKEMFFDSESLNRRFDFEKISPAKVLEILDDAKKGNMDVHDANLYLIYLSIPMFHNEKLLAQYGIKGSPYKIVEEIFENNVLEITQFADKILAIYGFDAEKVNKLKK